MSFAGSPGALAKPFRLLSFLPRELRGMAAAEGFLFSRPKCEAGEGPRGAASRRAAGLAVGILQGTRWVSAGIPSLPRRLLRKGHTDSRWEAHSSRRLVPSVSAARAAKLLPGDCWWGLKPWMDTCSWKARRVQA